MKKYIVTFSLILALAFSVNSAFAKTSKKGLDPSYKIYCSVPGYAMAVNCSTGNKRCYEWKNNKWNHTYGSRCKKNLSKECYEKPLSKLCK